MGIKTETITTCTCDICNKECGTCENEFEIQVSSAIGLETFIKVHASYSDPYVKGGAILCEKCMVKYLRKYLSESWRFEKEGQK